METSAWSSRPSPVSLSAGPLPRCLHQPVGGQLSLEQSTLWGVCLLGPPAPPDAAPRRGVSGGGAVWCNGCCRGAGAGPPGWALVSIPDTTSAPCRVRELEGARFGKKNETGTLQEQITFNGARRGSSQISERLH